jgi:hypothetical protein
MKRFLFLTCGLVALCMAAAAMAAINNTARPQTQIITDQATGTIRFIVDGAEQARIDKTGLHVRDSIEYSGTITDTGETAHAK